jgi:hypothetical protein
MKWLPEWANSRLAKVGVIAAIITCSLGGLAGAETLVQSFTSDTPLEPGWVVAINEKDSKKVEPSPASDSNRMYGVVVDPSQVPFTLQREKGQQVFVATTGTYPVFVSNENGSISPGDFVSIAGTDGIAAKAQARQVYVLGKAVEKYDGKSNVITKAKNGSTIGRINVTVIPGKNPLVKTDVAVPSALKKVGDGISGKDTTAIRIYTAMAIFLITSIVASVVLWVGVRGGMIAIGRNPLSRRYIIRGLIQVIVISILIFVVGIVAVYLLLKI